MKIEIYENGQIDYSVELKQFETIMGYTIPFSVVFFKDKKVQVDITINRYWPDASVAHSAFTLKRPVDAVSNEFK